MNVESRLGRTVTCRAGAGRWPAARARSVYEPAGSEGRKNRPPLSDIVTRPAASTPLPNSEITTPATGAPRVSSTQPTRPPPGGRAIADEADKRKDDDE